MHLPSLQIALNGCSHWCNCNSQYEGNMDCLCIPGKGVIPDNKSCRNSYWFKAQSQLDAGFTCNTVTTDYERQFFDGLLWSELNTFLYLPLHVIKLSIGFSEQNNNDKKKKNCCVKFTAFWKYWSTISQNVDLQIWEIVCEPWATVFQNYLLLKINLIYREP